MGKFLLSFLLCLLACGVVALSHPVSAKPELAVPQIKKNKFDLKIDDLIVKSLGERFRRATIYDIYPVITGNKKKANYYNYARNFLKKFSQGVLLKVYKFNFDGDSRFDYAVIVHDREKIQNSLLIANQKKVLYFEKFQRDYLEPVDGGNFPTVVPTEQGKVTVKSPALKLVSISEKGRLLYYDRKARKWKEVSLVF